MLLSRIHQFFEHECVKYVDFLYKRNNPSLLRRAWFAICSHAEFWLRKQF